MVNAGCLLTGALAALSFGLANAGDFEDLYAGIAESLKHPAPQGATNGASKWGTEDSPTYQHYLTNNPLPGGKPWGSLSAEHSNPYRDAPYTGVTRRYDFTIDRIVLAPDGVVRDMIVINGQFPGPTIEANWGDWIEGGPAARARHAQHTDGVAQSRCTTSSRMRAHRYIGSLSSHLRARCLQGSNSCGAVACCRRKRPGSSTLSHRRRPVEES